jgi:hypothetical protein
MYIEIKKFVCKLKRRDLGSRIRTYTCYIDGSFDFNYTDCIFFLSFRHTINYSDVFLLRDIGVESVNKEIMLLW